MSGKTMIFLPLRELRRSDVGPHLPLQGAFGLLMRDIFGGKYRYISGSTRFNLYNFVIKVLRAVLFKTGNLTKNY